MKAKRKFQCADCGVEFTVSCDRKEEIGFCPFCGEEIPMGDDEDNEDDLEESF